MIGACAYDYCDVTSIEDTMELEIVDAHMHLWTPQTHPWVTKAAREGGHPAGSFGKQ